MNTCLYCERLYEGKVCPSCHMPTLVLFATIQELSANEVKFSRAIRTVVLARLDGEMGAFAFNDVMFSAIRDGIRDAWIEGAAMVGFTPGEFNASDERKIQDATNSVLQYVLSLQADIAKRRERIIFAPEEREKNVEQLRNRIKIWDARYEQNRSTAVAHFGADQKLEWVWDPRKEHCTSCEKLNGKVKRASWWRDNGILPNVPGAWYLI